MCVFFVFFAGEVGFSPGYADRLLMSSHVFTPIFLAPVDTLSVVCWTRILARGTQVMFVALFLLRCLPPILHSVPGISAPLPHREQPNGMCVCMCLLFGRSPIDLRLCNSVVCSSVIFKYALQPKSKNAFKEVSMNTLKHLWGA